MIVRSINETFGTEREVSADGWTSRRLLLANEGMGFSFHETIIHEGAELTMHYKNHLEAVLCIAGEGSLTDLETGKTYGIAPGVMYALSEHERHILRATKEMRMICVFNPPVTGREVHGADGAYPSAEEMKQQATA